MTLLTNLRDAFRDETGIERLTASAPPVVRQVNKIERSDGSVYFEVDEEMEPADRNGLNLSATMVTLIGSLTAELNFYPPRFPVRRALSEWDRICRRRHRGAHWWDHSTEAICGSMLRAIVEGDASITWAAEQARISYPRAERLIGAGAAFVAERLAKWQDEQLGIVHDRESCAVCREEDALSYAVPHGGA